MNYIQKTPFMELYEELSKLHEAETAHVLNTSNVVSNDELDDMLRGYTSTLRKICGTTAQNVVIFLTRSFSSNICNAGSIARSCLASSDCFNWHYIENRSSIATSSTRKNFGDSLANSEIDLTGSWIVFNFLKSTPDSSVIAEELSRALNLPEDDATFIQPCEALGKNIYKNGAVNGVAFPYTTGANKSTLLNFCSLITDNVTSLDAFKQAKEFIKEFTKEHPTRIQCTEDGRPRAIHVPTLVKYYLNRPIEKEVMDVLLKTYFNGTTLGKNPDPDHPHRSVQYLYNAIQQERVMAQNGFTHNGTATNAGEDVQDSYEWLVQRSSGTADFYFGGQEDITVEAKQGLPVSADWRLIKSAHNAQYVVHFSYTLGTNNSISTTTGKWYLYKRANEISGAEQDKGTPYILVTEDRITTDFEQELFSKTQELNKGCPSLELVRL
jgi:hypothetical protein